MNPESALTRWIKAHELVAYLILTFILTFGGWVAAVLTGFTTAFDIGLWGPALAAVLLTARTRGMPGLKDLLRRLLHWRVPARWYLVILIGWPAVMILAALVHAGLTGQALTFQWGNWSGFRLYLGSALVLGLWACEEIGWRGFALPRLLKRWNALFASVVLGVIWWVWHLPYYLINGTVSPEFFPFLLYLAAVSVIMTWIFRHTQGSIFVATLFHLWVNLYSGLQSDKLPLADPSGQARIESIVLAVVAVLLVVLYGARSLSRQRKAAIPVELKAKEAHG
jgi:membrane protease YdiL (CAAX protease family)